MNGGEEAGPKQIADIIETNTHRNYQGGKV
jgi:hypothetical protein